jgi:hypothetical protein
MRTPATPHPVAGTGAVRSAPSVYCGFSLRATGGAVATVRIWDNAAAAAGVLLEVIALPVDGSAREYYAPGINARLGVYVEVVAGVVEGSVRIA